MMPFLVEVGIMAKRYRVTLTEQERHRLEDLTRKGKASVRMVRRAQTLLLAADEERDEEIATALRIGISTVALAGQISREFSVSDHGLDMEIEFKSDRGEATGRRLYLQLKSGDSYLRQRQRDGAEVFTIKGERHARYWAEQAYPVMLVIRTAEGEVRWMEIGEYLRSESDDGRKPVRQIVFDGERLDVMSVRRWRQQALGLEAP